MGGITDKLWQKAANNKIPLIGAFELLPMCNLKCKMCYVRKTKAEVDAMGGLMPKEFWLEYARQARDAGLLFPMLTGGEPFLHKDFQEIYAKMSEMGLQISMNSNGTLINEEMAKWLSKRPPVRINITLYGGSADSYERLCGDGAAYDKLRTAVDWLKKYGVRVKFNTSITPENVNDLDDMMNYAKSVGSPIQVATYMFPPIRRDENSFGQNHRLSPEEAGRARAYADWLQNEPAWFIGQAKNFSHFVPVTDEMFAEQSAKEPQRMNCRAGLCSFWLDWQGNLGNCGMYTSVKLPLSGRSFTDAWQEVVEKTAAIRYSPVCTNCPNYHLCHSCIAMVNNESGSHNGRPDYLCKMNEAAAVHYQELLARMEKDGIVVNEAQAHIEQHRDMLDDCII